MIATPVFDIINFFTNDLTLSVWIYFGAGTISGLFLLREYIKSKTAKNMHEKPKIKISPLGDPRNWCGTNQRR